MYQTHSSVSPDAQRVSRRTATSPTLQYCQTHGSADTAVSPEPGVFGGRPGLGLARGVPVGSDRRRAARQQGRVPLRHQVLTAHGGQRGSDEPVVLMWYCSHWRHNTSTADGVMFRNDGWRSLLTQSTLCTSLSQFTTKYSQQQEATGCRG